MNMNHVSDLTRRDVWFMLCDLERSRRYYGGLGDRYRLRYRGLRYFLLLLVFVECFAVSLAMTYPLEALVFGGILAAVLCLLTVVDSLTNYGEVSAELRVAAAACDDLGSLCLGLWLDVETYRVSEDEARSRMKWIDDQWTRVCQRVALELHRHDNEQAAISAYRVVSGQHGGRFTPSG